jgi:SAM-dependent methyltransferase
MRGYAPVVGDGERLKPDAAALREARDRLARDHGPWLDRVVLGEGVHTGSAHPAEGERRLKAILQAAADGLDKELSEARVLDLGAAEGRYAVEFALHGAEVVAIEGRQGNVEKTQFLKDALGLERLGIVRGDVRSLSAEAHGRFDLVLCLGLLYHLEGIAAVRLVHAIAEMTRRLVVFETHVALAPRSSITVDDRIYWGRPIREFDPGAPLEMQERLSRSALGNAESFWLTRASLFNLLTDAGFTSVAELHVPRFRKSLDHVTLVAFMGMPCAVVSAPGAEGVGAARWPERERRRPAPNATWRGALKLRLAPYAPAVVKDRARRRRERRWMT